MPLIETTFKTTFSLLGNECIKIRLCSFLPRLGKAELERLGPMAMKEMYSVRTQHRNSADMKLFNWMVYRWLDFSMENLFL